MVDIAKDTWAAGGAANVALNIASLGARCSLFGYFGNDNAGTQLKNIVLSSGISVLFAPGNASTIVKTRVLVQHQQLCRLDREGPLSAYYVAPDAVRQHLESEISRCDAVIISDYAKGLVTDEVIACVTALAHSAGKLVALDPKPKRNLKFQGLDLITPNKREALQLAQLAPPPHAPFPADEVCRKLHNRYGTKNLVITMGEDGMLLSRNGQVEKTIPTAAREVYDVSGAGDTALAALLLALVAGAPLDDAAHFSNAAAGVVVGKIGTATVTPLELLAHAGADQPTRTDPQ